MLCVQLIFTFATKSPISYMVIYRKIISDRLPLIEIDASMNVRTCNVGRTIILYFDLIVFAPNGRPKYCGNIPLHPQSSSKKWWILNKLAIFTDESSVSRSNTTDLHRFPLSIRRTLRTSDKSLSEPDIRHVANWWIYESLKSGIWSETPYRQWISSCSDSGFCWKCYTFGEWSIQ